MSKQTCIPHGSSNKSECGKLRLDELRARLVSGPGRVINDTTTSFSSETRVEDVLWREYVLFCKVATRETFWLGIWASSIFSVPTKVASTSRRSNASSGRTGSRNSSLSLSQNALMSAFHLPQILDDSKAHTLRIKCCSWSTRSCNHERPSGFVIRSFGLRPTGATPLKSNFNPANCSLQEFFHRQEAMSAYFRTTRIVNQQHTRPRDHRIE